MRQTCAATWPRPLGDMAWPVSSASDSWSAAPRSGKDTKQRSTKHPPSKYIVIFCCFPSKEFHIYHIPKQDSPISEINGLTTKGQPYVKQLAREFPVAAGLRTLYANRKPLDSAKKCSSCSRRFNRPHYVIPQKTALLRHGCLVCAAGRPATCRFTAQLQG